MQDQRVALKRFDRQRGDRSDERRSELARVSHLVRGSNLWPSHRPAHEHAHRLRMKDMQADLANHQQVVTYDGVPVKRLPPGDEDRQDASHVITRRSEPLTSAEIDAYCEHRLSEIKKIPLEERIRARSQEASRD
jgi:hypothetical protein